jgi:acetylornithine/succinyldiaminopimelate/putrescine aminotransferase
LKPGFLARQVLQRVQDAGVLLTAAGERVLRFTPPLVVTRSELEEGIRAVRSALEKLRAPVAVEVAV